MRRSALLALTALSVCGCRAVAGDRAPAGGSPAGAVAAAESPTSPPASDPRIEAVATGDFVTRSRAAGALVREGEPALPALGRAGPLDLVVHGRTTVSATRPLIAEILAKVPEDRLVAVWIPCPWPVVREGAAEEAGHRSAWTAVPALIARLEDPVPDVRTAAALALRRVTNRVDAGVPATAEDGRLLAASWRAWWDREGRLRAPDPSRTPSG